MRTHLHLASAILPVLATASLIPDVTQKAFETLLKDNNLLLTSFSSRTFEPVQSFYRTFEEAAENARTPFVTVDCDEEKDLCKEYDVNAYPAVRLFKRGVNEVEMTRYRGRRTKKAIQSFLRKHELPSVTHVESKDLPSFKSTDDSVVVAYLRPDQEALLNVFSSVASKHHQAFVFGYVTDMPTADAEGLAMPSIVCYKNTDGDNKVINGHFTEGDVENLLEAASRTIIGDFSERNMDAYMAVSTGPSQPTLEYCSF